MLPGFLTSTRSVKMNVISFSGEFKPMTRLDCKSLRNLPSEKPEQPANTRT